MYTCICNISFKGWNSQAPRGLPGGLASSNVSRDNVSREIGRRCSNVVIIIINIPTITILIIIIVVLV